MTASRKKVQIAAHMGVHGSNIPGNTLAAFEIALRQGADIIELDVTKSADDVLFVFHPGFEKVRLERDTDIRTLPAAEIEQLHFVNVDRRVTAHRITRLADALDFLRNRCVVNIDKFCDNPKEIAALVRSMGMQDQVIVKTPPEQQYFDCVAQVAHDLPYMPFVYELDTCFEALARRKDLRYIGAEAVFKRDDSMLASDDYLSRMHRLGKKVWINSIRFNDGNPLAGSRFDDLALWDDPDKVWGWMARKGYDIIQTDWTLALFQYLRPRGY